MKIKWLGHSCFLLTNSKGVRILTDPFDESVGYPVPHEEADIVTTSHDHFDHNFIAAVKGDFKHFSIAGEYTEKGIEIRGIASYHDEAEGSKRGSNVIFTFRTDGLGICHLGDLGHTLSDEQINAVGNVDILMLPVGGTYTIDHNGAAEVTRQLRPRTVIPMHFKTPVMDFPINGVDKYLAAMGDGSFAGAQEIDINREKLERTGGVLVLEYE